MQVVSQAKQRKSGKMRQASRSSQADIKSDAGRCRKVKETKESIGLAGKKPSKQKETGNYKKQGSEPGKSRQDGGDVKPCRLVDM
jgi:hypothetical protein